MGQGSPRVQGDPSGAVAHGLSGRAQWITGEGVPAHDQAVLRLRKELVLDGVPSHFTVHVSADNQFLLVVNGMRVGQGPAIGDVQHWRYETYDLAPMLHAGRNVLAATVWNGGTATPIRQMSSQLGFVLDPESLEASAAATNSTWMARQDTGITFLPKPAELHEFYYVGSPGERMDGATIDWGWSDAAAEAHEPEWKPAVSLGTAVGRGVNSENNSWLLVPDELPAMEYATTEMGHVVHADGVAEAASFPSAPLSIPAHTRATLLLDRETLTTAFPALTISGGQGAHVTLRYAEALVDEHGDKGNRNEVGGKHLVGVADEFLPDGGAHREFAPLDWRTWRYVSLEVVTAAEPLRLERFTAAFTAFPFERRARFASDDASLTAIWDVGWRTARLCAHDAYMDTPYWERLQYVGDTRIQALISYTNAGDDRLARQAITAFRSSLQPEGIGQSRYPSRHLQVIQNFSLLWISMVHDFWYYRNDKVFVQQQIPAMRSELSYFRARLDANGLPEMQDWWPFVDWATGFAGGSSPASNDGVSAAGSLFYLAALRDAAEMEQALGDRGLGREDAEEAGRLTKTILAQFWSPQEQLLADTAEKQHFSQQANALAVWLDVVPRERQTEVMTRIYSATDRSFNTERPVPQGMSVASSYFRFYLTRALVHAGMGDRYLETLTPWRTMLANGLTTWAEQPEPTRSDSHAWSAHPNIDLMTTVAGLTPSAPEFAAVDVTPRLGSLHHLTVSYPSPRGEITAEYVVDGGGLTVQIDLPEGLSGTLHWNGIAHALRPGINRLQLPPRSAEAGR